MLRRQREGTGTCVCVCVCPGVSGREEGAHVGVGRVARAVRRPERVKGDVDPQRCSGMLCSLSGGEGVVMRMTTAQFMGMGTHQDPTPRFLPTPGTRWPHQGLLCPAVEEQGFAISRSSRPLRPWATGDRRGLVHLGSGKLWRWPLPSSWCSRAGFWSMDTASPERDAIYSFALFHMLS